MKRESDKLANQIAALQLLKVYTRGTFDFWDMMGPYNAAERAEVMTALCGKRVPQSRSGVTQMRSIFHDRARIVGDHIAARQTAFAQWANETLSTA